MRKSIHLFLSAPQLPKQNNQEILHMNDCRHLQNSAVRSCKDSQQKGTAWWKHMELFLFWRLSWKAGEEIVMENIWGDSSQHLTMDCGQCCVHLHFLTFVVAPCLRHAPGFGKSFGVRGKGAASRSALCPKAIQKKIRGWTHPSVNPPISLGIWKRQSERGKMLTVKILCPCPEIFCTLEMTAKSKSSKLLRNKSKHQMEAMKWKLFPLRSRARRHRLPSHYLSTLRFQIRKRNTNIRQILRCDEYRL